MTELFADADLDCVEPSSKFCVTMTFSLYTPIAVVFGTVTTNDLPV